MTESKNLSPEFHFVGTIGEQSIYEIIPDTAPLSETRALGAAAARRCFDPRALKEAMQQATAEAAAEEAADEPATSQEVPPINEVEAMARLYGKYGVTAATMASAPVKNEIYDVSAYSFLSND